MGANRSSRLDSSEIRPSSLRSGRYDSLDVWRGIACLMIVVTHATSLLPTEQWAPATANPLLWALWKARSNLYIGVPLFFVISGYCIAATLEGSVRKGHGMAAYFKRRYRRIYPPYWAICGISLALVMAVSYFGADRLLVVGDDRFPPPSQMAPLQWLGSITLTETWRYHLTGGANGVQHFFGPSWTLCYEEQFYAVAGVLLWILPRSPDGQRRLRGIWIGLAIVSLATLVTSTYSTLTHSTSLGGVFLDGRFLIFGSGLLAYYVLHRASPRRQVVLLATLAVAIVLGTLVRYGVLPKTGTKDDKLLVFEVVVGGAFGMLLVLLHRWDKRFVALRVLSPLRYCGEMCYSLYLVHWPITILISHGFDELGVKGLAPVLLLTAPVATAASILASRLFYRNVEMRFLNPPQTTPVDSLALGPSASTVR